MGVEITGFNYFGQIADALPELTSQIVRATATAILSEAISLAPIKTGHLRGSGHLEDGETPYSMYVVFSADYAADVELGSDHHTYKIPPHPFLIPALEHHYQEFLDAFSAIGRSRRFVTVGSEGRL